MSVIEGISDTRLPDFRVYLPAGFEPGGAEGCWCFVFVFLIFLRGPRERNTEKEERKETDKVTYYHEKEIMVEKYVRMCRQRVSDE